MKIFATLPADARRALARKELQRRGLKFNDSADTMAGLSFSTDEELARMEELHELYPNMPDSELPPEIRSEWRQLTNAMVSRIRAADVGGGT